MIPQPVFQFIKTNMEFFQQGTSLCLHRRPRRSSKIYSYLGAQATNPHIVRLGGQTTKSGLRPATNEVQVAPGKTNDVQLTTGKQWSVRSLSWWRSPDPPPRVTFYFISPVLLLHHVTRLPTDVIQLICAFFGREKYRGDLFSGKSWEYQDYHGMSTTHVPKWRRTVLNGSHGEWTESDDVFSRALRESRNRQMFKRPLLANPKSGVDGGIAQMNKITGSSSVEMRDFTVNPIHPPLRFGLGIPVLAPPPVTTDPGYGQKGSSGVVTKTVVAETRTTKSPRVLLDELKSKMAKKRAGAVEKPADPPPAVDPPVLSPLHTVAEPTVDEKIVANRKTVLQQLISLQRNTDLPRCVAGPYPYNSAGEFMGPLNWNAHDFVEEVGAVEPLDAVDFSRPLHGPVNAVFVYNERGSTRFAGLRGDWDMQRSVLDTPANRYTPQVTEVVVPRDDHLRALRVPTTLPMKRSTCVGFLWRITRLPRRALACLANPFGFDRGLLDCLLDPPVGPASGMDLDPLPEVEVLGESTDLSRMVGYRTTYVAPVLPEVENFLVNTFSKSIAVDTYCMARMRAVAVDKMAELYPGESFGDDVLVNTVARAAARLKLMVAHGASHQGLTHERVQVRQW